MYFPLLNCPKHSTYVIYPLSSFLPSASSSRTTAVLYPTHSDAMPFPVPEDTPANKNCSLDCHYNSPRYSERCERCNEPLERITSGTLSITSHLSFIPGASSSAGRLGTKAPDMVEPGIGNMKRERIGHDAEWSWRGGQWTKTG